MFFNHMVCKCQLHCSLHTFVFLNFNITFFDVILINCNIFVSLNKFIVQNMRLDFFYLFQIKKKKVIKKACFG